MYRKFNLLKQILPRFYWAFDRAGCSEGLEKSLGLILVVNNILSKLSNDLRWIYVNFTIFLIYHNDLTRFFFWHIKIQTCSSSWIEAVKGSPSATLATIVIKIIFENISLNDLTRFFWKFFLTRLRISPISLNLLPSHQHLLTSSPEF